MGSAALPGLRDEDGFQVLPATHEQIPAIIRIAEKQLGHAYIDLDLLTRPKSIVVVAVSAGRVVGFCSGYKMSRAELYLQLPQLEDQRTRSFDALEEVGYIASIATDPAELGKGIASGLLAGCICRLEAESVPAIVMTGWKSKAGVHIKSMAIRLGFEEIIEIDNFWHDNSLREGYFCPECGSPPCRCSAVVFYK